MVWTSRKTAKQKEPTPLWAARINLLPDAGITGANMELPPRRCQQPFFVIIRQ
jgi:hypothetical protein